MKRTLAFVVFVFILMVSISSAETVFSQFDGSSLVLVEKLDGKYYFYDDMIGRFLTKQFKLDGVPVGVAHHVVSSFGVWHQPRFIIMWDTSKKAFAMGISRDGETVSGTSYIYPGTIWYEAFQVLSKCHKVPPNE